MAAKILVVEDDPVLRSLLREQLTREGYEVSTARDGVEGERLCRERAPDLILLDVLLPRMDGWEACRRIRELSDAPIIILTAMARDVDKVRGLELGADDYVTKPYSQVELVARIRAALRRFNRAAVAESLVQVDDRLAVDWTRRQVTVQGEPLELSATEFKLLAFFLENAGRVLTHQSLLTHVWGWEYTDEVDYLKVYVHHLRKKIEPDPNRPQYIVTERVLGYRFQAPARE
jgi:two-component system KDP operon response regulator KdpE